MNKNSKKSDGFQSHSIENQDDKEFTLTLKSEIITIFIIILTYSYKDITEASLRMVTCINVGISFTFKIIIILSKN